MQRKPTSKKSMNLETMEEVPTGDVPEKFQGQALAEAITIAMSRGLEPLLAAKETKNNQPNIAVRVMASLKALMMLMKRYLETAHTKDTPLERAWTIVEFLKSEVKDYIKNTSEA